MQLRALGDEGVPERTRMGETATLQEVGFDRKTAIATVIRKMNKAREKRSAHGSTPQRTIRPAELLEFQACAEVIVLAGLEKARGTELFA